MQSSKASVEKGNGQSKLGAVTEELEETRKSLERAREEGSALANHLKSLREELEQTKRELRHLKSSRQPFTKLLNPEIEDLKFVENNNVNSAMSLNEEVAAAAAEAEFQKKRYVSFASPPSLTRVIVREDDGTPNVHNKMRKDQRADSPRRKEKKEKKKPLGTLIRRIFS